MDCRTTQPDNKSVIVIAYLTKGNVVTLTKKHQETTLNGDICMRIGFQPEDYYEEYNRKTVDFGNGRIEVVAYHSPQLKYLGNNRRSVLPTKKPVLSDEAQEERTHKQIYAIRRRIKWYALSNDFRWFVTLTFDPEKIDSFNFEIAKKALLKWCRLMRDRYKRFDYIIIPELHQSGAVHFHGLLGDIPAHFVEATHPRTGKPLVRHDRQVYNLADWEYGYTDCEQIESPERAASYITKYVTTALLTNKEMYNKKRYFNSQGLHRPDVSYAMEDNEELRDFTPNFGVIDTDSTGKNIIDKGIYNLNRDSETGELTQSDTDYLLIAKS